MAACLRRTPGGLPVSKDIAMHPKPRFLLLSAALGAALCTSAPVFAQAAGGDDAIVAEATVPAARLADRYAELAGSADAATTLISDLRQGSDFTVSEQVTTTNPDGTTTTSTVDRTIVNPNGPMGYGEINITLAMAQELVASGAYPDLQSALTGTTTTVTNPDGTTTTTTSGGVLAMRADGMGWGKIAKQLGLNLGALVSASNGNGKSQHGATHAAAKAKPDGVAKADHASRPDRVEHPQRPDKPERPQRPDKPERGGGHP
jgi:hypothetical protein